MIVKNSDAPTPKDKFEAAGLKAEQQMAYYLQRAFGDDKQVFVLNGLRIELGGNVAQMDHLILHTYGWIIVESKSVTSEVSINEHGEWARKWEGRFQGMPSPIKQAERQLELFNRFMDEKIPTLITRRMQMLGPIKASEFQSGILIAISDNGLISGKHRPDGVLKAEAIVDEVKNRILQNRKTAKALFTLKTYQDLGEGNLQDFSQMLLSHHTPLVPGAPKPVAAERKPAVPVVPPIQGFLKQCRKCQSTKLEMLWGKYGYYLKCLECEENTPVVAVFPEFKEGYKIRKQGPQFFLEHAEKGTSVLFHTNP
ncbi:nuclease-related domain-containing protein [Deinococcus roseus]|uniref:NERD domain-containing protein n=1 Tax=Deinococcus roseus TaxID=392414 RepID=A0ABQ2D336_9DEIO|nr:nuclease-related domain-containing protein [Deinococcus roseus]GGJ44060.1 hypothetical protein GCM10008938_32920 [Deinococcus roseus]